MADKDNEAAYVEATPIEDELVARDAIERQLSELAGRAAELAAQYRPHEIEDRQDHKDSRRARGEVRKAARAIKDEGKAITARVDRWSAGVKSAASRIAERLEDLGDEYDGYVKAYEGQIVARRRDMLRERYEDFAPGLALPAEGTDEALVPFGRLWDAFAGQLKWANFGTNDVRAASDLERAVEAIGTGERTIESLVVEEDQAEVKATYFQTLDMDRAMARASELKAARARVEAMEAERAAWAAQAGEAPEAGPEPEGPRPVETGSVVTPERFESDWQVIHGAPRPVPPQTELATSRAATWLLYCRCTPQQAGELEAYARRIGISRIICRDGGTAKYRLVKAKE